MPLTAQHLLSLPESALDNLWAVVRYNAVVAGYATSAQVAQNKIDAARRNPAHDEDVRFTTVSAIQNLDAVLKEHSR